MSHRHRRFLTIHHIRHLPHMMQELRQPVTPGHWVIFWMICGPPVFAILYSWITGIPIANVHETNQLLK